MSKVEREIAEDGWGRDISREYSEELYNKVGGNTYDKMMRTGYRGNDVMVEAMCDLYPVKSRRSIKVLDVGAGTGITGEMLQDAGFAHLDGVEPHPNMAQLAEDKKIYGNVLRVYVGGGNSTGISENSYDAITTVGTFAPGHMPPDGLLEMIRVVKPGGYICITMRESCMSYVLDYRGVLQPLMDRLVREGRWRRIRWEVYQKHCEDHPGLLIVHQVC